MYCIKINVKYGLKWFLFKWSPFFFSKIGKFLPIIFTLTHINYNLKLDLDPNTPIIRYLNI